MIDSKEKMEAFLRTFGLRSPLSTPIPRTGIYFAGQSFLLDAFPRRQHAVVISIFGMANMIGPSLGPMFAGQIAEGFGWQWGFWMIVPVAIAAVAGNFLFLPRGRSDAAARLDWLGFLSLSAGIAAAQLVFSRGQRLDWFESTEIVVATLIAGIAIYMFCAHSLTSSKPFVRLTLLTNRNYSVGLLLIMWVLLGNNIFGPG